MPLHAGVDSAVSAERRSSGLLVAVVNFNQEQEIGELLQCLMRHHPCEGTIVVDDGSTDTSPSIAEALGFKVLRHGNNRGIGAAIRTAIYHGRAAGFRYITIMSSNGKLRPQDLQAVSGPVCAGTADYVVGSRFLRSGDAPGLGRFRRLAIPLLSLIASAILRRRFSDITCGYRCYTLELFDSPSLQIDQPWLDRYELEYYIQYRACRLGLRILEVPVTVSYSHLKKGRYSKIAPISGWWCIIRPFVLLPLGIKK